MKANRQEFFILQDLLDRGWTRGLVEKHLDPPDKTRRGRNNVIRLYSVERVKKAERRVRFREDVKRLKARRSVVPRECDLLAAIFAVNRAAKRRRQTAHKHYRAGRYGLASLAKSQKEKFYSLKDKGIVVACQLGRITPVAIQGGLCLWRGEGYAFHSHLKPKGIELAPDDYASAVFIEAKAQGRHEPKQRDAIYTLENLSVSDLSAFDLLDVPTMDLLERPYMRTSRSNDRVEYEEVLCDDEFEESIFDDDEWFKEQM